MKKYLLFISALLINFQIVGQNTNLYLNQYIRFSQIKDYPNAIASIKKAIKMEPWNSELYLYQGITYYKMDQLKKALQSFKDRKSTRLNSSH